MLIGEYKEYSRVYVKKYNLKGYVCDKYWRDDLNDYLYCVELDESISDDPDYDYRVLCSLSTEKMIEYGVIEIK